MYTNVFQCLWGNHNQFHWGGLRENGSIKNMNLEILDDITVTNQNDAIIQLREYFMTNSQLPL